MQGKHYKSRGLKRKIVAPVLAAVLLASTAVPAITAGFRPATAASVDGKSVGLASNEYNAPVNSSNSANNNLYWADATYFDYLSDAEITNGWLNTVKAGTGFNGSVDEWYPYYLLNRDVVKNVADNHSGWSKPLYFGNFCNTSGAYDTSGHHSGVSNGYTDATNSYNVTRFDYAPNNSNGLNNYNESYQGLMSNALDANGNLLTPDGTKAPYFDKDLLTGTQADKAKVVNSKFPFTQEKRSLANGKEYTYYEFNSENAEDNVYFTWDNGKPTAVNYGAGTAYGVLDGIQYFMNPDEGYKSGYGIFPFNNRNATGENAVYFVNNGNWSTPYAHMWKDGGQGTTWPGTAMTHVSGNLWKVTVPNGYNHIIFSNNGSNQTGDLSIPRMGATYNNGWVDENLDYGFGIKTSMKFRVPKYGTLDGTASGQPVTFTYSGDDDLWVYITDQTTNTSQLVLDLGGNHKQSEGEINFKTKVATAKKVYNNRQNVTKSFTFDDTHTYEMTVFYMERGMLESNCKMAFTMVPLGNDVAVTEIIDTTDINDGLKTAVAGVDEFTFRPLAGENGTTPVTNLSYIGNGESKVMTGNTFNLGSNSAAYFNNVFTTGDTIKVEQTKQTNSYLTYDSAWTFTDNAGTQQVSTGYKENIGSGYATDTKRLINSTTNPDLYEYAALQADFVNKPKSANVTITKQLEGATSDTTDFGGMVEVKLSESRGWEKFPLTYKIGGSSYTLTDGGKLANGGKLRKDRTLTFNGIPVGAYVRFTEDTAPAGYSFVSVSGGSTGIKVGASGGAITVSNRVQSGNDTITVHKRLDQKAYNGNQFTFNMSLQSSGIGAHTFVQSAPAVDPVSSVVNGDVTFTLSFNTPGWYCYKITEAPISQDLTDLGYFGDDLEYYVVFKVSTTADGLKIDRSGEGAPAFYDDAYMPLDEVIFDNSVYPGIINIIKSDRSGNPVPGVEFGVVKVKNSDQPANYWERINALLASDKVIKGKTQNGDLYLSNGDTLTGVSYVAFDNLPIYQNGDQVYNMATGQWENGSNYATGNMVTQTYMVFEYSPKNGFNTNKMVKFVTFPYESSYEVTFDYVNAEVISPKSGSFTQVFVPVGAGVLGGSLLLAGAYVLYNKKSRAKRKVRHGRRFK